MINLNNVGPFQSMPGLQRGPPSLNKQFQFHMLEDLQPVAGLSEM